MECDWGADSTLQAVHHGPRPRALVITVRLDGGAYDALIDSGSSVSMILAPLVPPGLTVIRRTAITCLHGHAEESPVVMVLLEYLGETW